MSWDRALLLWLNTALACPAMDLSMVAVSRATGPALVAAMLPLLLTRRRREGRMLPIAFLASVLLSVALQFVLLRARPDGVRLVLPMPAFPSFPSGHAAGAAACATLAALFWPRARVPALLGTAGVALSRVYLGLHYPSDVLGGAILGAAVGLVVYGCLYLCDGGGRPRWTWLLWGQAAVVLLATLCAYLGLLRLPWLAVPGLDKLLHGLLFGGLAFGLLVWWQRWPPAATLGALSLLIGAEEGLQALSPLRSFDLLGLLASLAGVLLGGLAAWRLRRRAAPPGER